MGHVKTVDGLLSMHAVMMAFGEVKNGIGGYIVQIKHVKTTMEREYYSAHRIG